ncbi:hypothetical protein TUMEXPCC7403_25155 [Tumidithrix helvetica PCC 7403]|uniref:hypothetical protein n=1 Tax=Tumidithrix helvetica TaxID=3457545 RepID=UPI003CB7329E
MFSKFSKKSAKPMAALLSVVAIGGTINIQAAGALTVQKNSDGTAIHVGELQPSTSTEFIFTGVTQTKSVVSNGCGGLVLKGNNAAPLPSLITVNGTQIDISTLPLGLKPTCSGGSYNVPPSGNFKVSATEVFIINQTPNAAIQVSYDGSTVRRVTSNACGLAKVSKSGTFTPNGAFTITGQSGNFNFNSLPVVQNPDICKNGVLYRAVN